MLMIYGTDPNVPHTIYYGEQKNGWEMVKGNLSLLLLYLHY